MSLQSKLILAAAVCGLLGATTPASANDSVATALAKADEVSVPNSYRRTITSTNNGITYPLNIFLPRGYDPESGERYPVFYFVPGDAFGIYLSQIARFLSSGDIPKLIIVGIDFPADDSYSMDLPTAGPDPHWSVPETRGAANFLNILRTEIKPYVDSEFPTDPTDAGIGGHSLGGFFALYAMFNAPETFTHIFASSPSLVWQDFILLREEANLAKRVKDLPLRAFMDQGGLEGDDGRLSMLDTAIRSRHYPSLRWEARRTPGQTHQTIAFADGIDALYFIYGPELRHPSEAEIASLTGEWLRSDGATFRIRAEDEHVYLVDFDPSDPESVELLSSKPDEWFIRYLWHRFDVVHEADGEVSLSIQLRDTPGPNGETKTPELSARRIAPLR